VAVQYLPAGNGDVDRVPDRKELLKKNGRGGRRAETSLR
jgi:hypothetical protein